MEEQRRIVAISRIKDSILTISEFLYRLSSLVDGVVIVDNGSTDGTEKAYEYFNDLVLAVEHTEGFDEGRDKVLALQTAKKYNPQWILYLDSDEIMEYGVTRDDLERMMSAASVDVYQFRLFHFWLSKVKYRFDKEYKYYTLSYQPRLWRNTPSLYMNDVKIHSGFVRGFDPRRARKTSIRLLHYGYIHQRQIDAKYNLYTTVDRYTDKQYSHLLKEEIKLKTFVGSFRAFPNFVFRTYYKIYYDAYWFVFRGINRLGRIMHRKPETQGSETSATRSADENT